MKTATHANKKTGQEVVIVSEYENRKGASVSITAIKDGDFFGPSRGMTKASFEKNYRAL